MYTREYTIDWDFRDSNTKEYTHCYHNYPAMMIPQIARKLIYDFAPQDSLKLILDPYMGSGTTLVESAIKGVDSVGIDINPLARFISEVKTTKYNIYEIKESFDYILEQIANFSISNFTYTETDFDHITKHDYWYSKENLIKLKYLSSIIEKLKFTSTIPFFNLALAEIIRDVSFTRNGEFKRYRIDAEKIPTYNPNPFSLIEDKVKRNIDGLNEFMSVTTNSKVEISDCNSVIQIPNSLLKKNSVDMVVTSPPYGDSRTTVAYGQFSRWASEWFKFPNAKNIDRTLMGGIPRKIESIETIALAKELELIKKADIKRYYEVVTFLDEYSQSIKNVASVVRKGGRVCYVVGNRTVKEIQIPLDYFTAEMFEKHGFKHEITYVRSIPNKRMPSKTSPSNKKGANVSTMTEEYIVILTKI
ncbi:MAG: DNA methyltransferase [Tannerellaceae bacterium]